MQAMPTRREALRQVQPTAAHMRRALVNLRQPSWPRSDEDALANPIISACVRQAALGYARDEAAGRTPAHLTGQRPARHTAWARTRAQAFDARRAAANDLEDDDE